MSKHNLEMLGGFLTTTIEIKCQKLIYNWKKLPNSAKNERKKEKKNSGIKTEPLSDCSKISLNN